MFFDQMPSVGVLFALFVALFVALAFEFVNGFHDTANAVATVIYTRALRAPVAVLYSGIFNFLGVMVAGVGVAYAVVNLFPVETLLTQQMGPVGLSMVFAVLVCAISWNLGTWYFGIPASSSHTMIGAIIGASMGYSMYLGIPLDQGVPWDKARTVMAALFLSPLLGFFSAAALLLVMRFFIKDEKLYSAPEGEQPPPGWIRALLIATCGGVSFAHGSNDGQKGMGLVMLILMGLVPAAFSLNLSASPMQVAQLSQRCHEASRLVVPQEATSANDGLSPGESNRVLTAYLKGQVDSNQIAPVLAASLEQTSRRLQIPLLQIPAQERAELRTLCVLEMRSLKKWLPQSGLPRESYETVNQCQSALESFVEYVATWVKVAVALALGLGTTVGWKRIVVTVGEKIGKTHLSYAQGAAASLVAASTILLADGMHLPASTTHVLSSGVAGSMYAQRAGLQVSTMKSIAMAWLLTLPVCITGGLGLFFIFQQAFR